LSSPVPVSTVRGTRVGAVSIASHPAVVARSGPAGFCHNSPHELRQHRIRRSRPRARMASVHADEGPRAAAADPRAPRRGRVARGLRGQALPRCHQLLVGESLRARESPHQRRGALAVGNVELYKEIYRPLLMDVITVPSPDCFQRERGESPAEYSRRQFAHMEAALGKHAQEACAVIVEPLVQCAGGMRMYDPVYLTLLREACDRHEVHLIADEIAVGFGRTGTMFACEQARIRPDFMCLSKGLTGGYLPLSAVMTTA